MTPQASHDVKNEDDVIPVNDVPAFGVQFRFVKRVFQDMLEPLRRKVRVREAASDEIPLGEFLDTIGRNPDGSRRAG